MIRIIWQQKVDLIMLTVLISSLIIGIIDQDWLLLGGGLLLSIGYSIFNFINKVILIKNNFRLW